MNTWKRGLLRIARDSSINGESLRVLHCARVVCGIRLLLAYNSGGDWKSDWKAAFEREKSRAGSRGEGKFGMKGQRVYQWQEYKLRFSPLNAVLSAFPMSFIGEAPGRVLESLGEPLKWMSWGRSTPTQRETGCKGGGARLHARDDRWGFFQ